jgi:hypothetical protein
MQETYISKYVELIRWSVRPGKCAQVVCRVHKMRKRPEKNVDRMRGHVTCMGR